MPQFALKLLGLFTILFFWLSPNVSAQFFLNGDAVQLNDTCYQLTPAVNNKVGSIWNPDKISLNESFDVVVQVNLGCTDDWGADGLVFGFQPVSTTIGVGGGGIGFLNVNPALGIEIDTWQNVMLNDPAYDHIAIEKNGTVNHNSPNLLAGPIQASTSSPNIEDCEFHDLRVSWDAGLHQLHVYFDCDLRLSYEGDIVNTIFAGDPLVYWGFTAGTGAANNIHQVCLSYTSFLDEQEDIVMCPGGQAQLHARGGQSYHWTPEAGIDDPFSPNPIVAPAQTTLYQLEVLDVCNFPFYDDILVEVAGDSVFFDLGPDTTICKDNPLFLDVTTPTAIYNWSTGATTPTLTVNNSGLYGVTVTRTDTFCTSVDFIDVNQLHLPFIELGPDTSLCLKETITLHASDPNATYLWSNGSHLDSLQVNAPGQYSIIATNYCGTANDNINISYEDCEKIYIPNAFSPNDDGVNDVFRPFHQADIVNIRVMRIFNRWGGLLYETHDFLPEEYAKAWNGKADNKPLDPGAYLYVLEVDFRNGNSRSFSGIVYLLR
ncbi:MAG: hypothetical protein DHS20C18_27440 [Saprospiraceae bacterium]|nr:MAG: hypothetical protein DHS20C18_27440 [Saprospiraceae bacterium]